MKVLSIIWNFFKEVDQKASDFLDNHEISPVFVKILSVNMVGLTMVKVHDVLGVISISLSIAYVLWKWRRDYKDSTKKSDTV